MKLDFKKIFSKKRNAKLSHKACINPHRGWRNLVWFAIFYGFMLIVFSMYLYFQIKNDNIFNVKQSDETKSEIIKQDILEKILNDFKEKENMSTQILEGNIKFIDPSI